AEEFAVSLDVNAVVAVFGMMTVTFLWQLADDLRAAHQIDTVDIPLAAEQRPGHILDIGIAAGGAAHYGAQVAAVERSSGNQFAQDVSEKTDSYRQEFSQNGVLAQTVSVGILDLKLTHAMCCPQLPGLEVISSHAAALLEFGGQFVEQVSVDADSGGDGSPGRSAGAEWDSEVVGKCIGRTERKNGKRDGRSS